ncbi:4-diphosphocytidyl-2-C-methyl-D-erythritol kinase [Acetobacter pasteurianus]|uniref:4-diphosphocytidyl-2-C-methyl-D-erythritol kinase n=3 Tax=Acetobacter pasteurianus TaxID=438 RepID=C7JCV1_ACEP3|nr:4-(cytidine 5'-diphospho)-2-C-methyl-D-erythritol kinase [Acetobacter pasteurianus]BAU37450.1 4-diphosphocytidyl-2-C-methyl-D-erythritol kinase [Acetobacter pasteurianus NBRC 101655]ASC05119.1 4-(cytidine 5'-diphospho)-2-C-methyl-D-erythritol kinase [Acetobacter pasteurianus subsp. pasteurianus]CCT59953.1 4-diphosphocytidyl-2-C-methyl-D-erythritol kinase [Acetobacter pasteurianus 386B]BAH98554.1 4-diphosphocytidyl-2-C-methyl-D-erythritol kinase [Acetobacter pasteurianus IFO 3283-01]BAI01605
MTVDVLDVATTTLTEIAPAKINLYLHVTGRRPDGYHLLDSLVVFAGAGDVLHYEPGTEPLHLKLEGRFGRALGADAAGADNLVMKAAAVLRDLAGPQANVQGGCLVLEKNLPVASGIGGGSADAAAALRLLNRAWNAQVDEPTLFRVAETLGADVPVCLLSQTVRMEGIGETLTPAPRLPECGLVLVNCGQAVSTPDVFRKRTGDFVPRADLPQSWPNSAAMVATLKAQENSLETPACTVCPPVKKVLADIAAQPDCQLARMSGSGATCFGVFPTVEAAREAADRLAEAHAAWWVWGGALV